MHEIGRIIKFGCEMLLIVESIDLRSLQILYLFVLRGEKVTIFGTISAKNAYALRFFEYITFFGFSINHCFRLSMILHPIMINTVNIN